MNKAKKQAARLARMAFLRAKAKLAVAARQAKAKLAALLAKSKAVAMSLMVAMMTTLPAFAEDGGAGGGATSSDLTTIVSSTDTVVSMINKAWAVMTSNELLRVYVAAGLLSVGIGFFGYLKRQSRH